MSVELQRDGRVFIQPYSKTWEGASIGDGLPSVIASMTDAQVLGSSIVAALHASNRRPLPNRNLRVDPPDREFLEWLGLRTYGQYMKGVRTLSVRAAYDNDDIAEVMITPERNGGPRGGFTPLSDERRTVMFESPEQLGRAVQEAMKRATA
ncbi:hypothetical protein HWD99_09560 [Microbacterium sp. C5A9]|uniref:hypothetical protein n=1 Tax=Microbacterium sp. C5A9 TaxID=2736663 RepID=UPI001F51E718|nr:hypothetical protein [Microbacterium sp. C5A9]MCI1018871.1 hypothetical protein [Microbacterium sp. C5A9]